MTKTELSKLNFSAFLSEGVFYNFQIYFCGKSGSLW